MTATITYTDGRTLPPGRPALLTDLLTRAFDGLGEDVSDTDGVLTEDVGVDAQRHGGVGVTEPCGDHVDGDSREEQRGRV
jgi:hypothetical protein